MANTIEKVALIQTTLDKAMIQGAVTGFMEDNVSNLIYKGGDEVKIPMIDMDGLANYNRQSGFVDGDVSLAYQTMKMTQDRGRGFTVDPNDIDESGVLDLMSQLTGEFQRTKVVPEVDAYRISKVVQLTPAANRTVYTPAAGTILKKMTEDIGAVRDEIGSDEQLVMLVSTPVSTILNTSTELGKKLDVTDFMRGEINTKVKALDSVPLLVAPRGGKSISCKPASTCAIDADARKCYPTMSIGKLKAHLKRDVRNPELLWLTNTLIDKMTREKYNLRSDRLRNPRARFVSGKGLRGARVKRGISIGSYLSCNLCNYMMSYAWHYMQEQACRWEMRKGKDGAYRRTRVRLITHCDIYMDNFTIYGKNKRDLMRAESIAHGSNTIARKHCGALVPASEAKPGYAMFRWREEGEPERYEDDGLDDFYHIGLKGRNGKVLNAKSTAAGFVESPDSGWKYAAPLLAVDYGEEVNDMAQETVIYSAVVCTKNDPLTLRDSPNGTKIGKLPKGCTVDVLAERDGWMQVRYGNLLGWASGNYLSKKLFS